AGGTALVEHGLAPVRRRGQARGVLGDRRRGESGVEGADEGQCADHPYPGPEAAAPPATGGAWSGEPGEDAPAGRPVRGSSGHGLTLVETVAEHVLII